MHMDASHDYKMGSTIQNPSHFLCLLYILGTSNHSLDDFYIFIYKRLLSVCVSGVGVQTVGPIATKFGRKVEGYPGNDLS